MDVDFFNVFVCLFVLDEDTQNEFDSLKSAWPLFSSEFNCYFKTL